MLVMLGVPALVIVINMAISKKRELPSSVVKRDIRTTESINAVS